MISDAIIRRVRYPPECIPDSWYGAVPLLGEVVPPILDLRRFQPKLVQLEDIQLPTAAFPNVAVHVRYDDVRIEEDSAAMLNLFPGAWKLAAKDYLFFNLYGTGVVPANCPTFYKVWSWNPTVAHKIIYRMAMSNEEIDIAERLSVKDSVDKGVLPLPLSHQMSREYYILGEETHSRNINIAIPATDYTIEVLYPRSDEFIAITRIAANPGTAAQNVVLYVDRDYDGSVATVATFPLSLITGGEIDCFIPAVKEIRLWTNAAVAPGPHLFRYTLRRIKLTSLLRVRFGLISKDEVPGDTYDKVIAGVL